MAGISLDEETLNTKLNDCYTYEYILNLFHEHCPQFKALNTKGPVKSINFVDINNGKGFTSNIYSTVVEFENTAEVFRVAIKIPSLSKLPETYDSQNALDTATQAHKTECQFYDLFHDVNDGFAPTGYYADVGDENHPGLIIMDDLSERCTTFGIFKSCTKQQFWNAARMIARFQAITACKHKDLSDFYHDFHVNSFHTMMLQPMVGYLAEYDEKYKEPVERLMKIFSKEFSQHALFDLPRKYECLGAMHGDIWTNNILFELNKDGSISDNPLHFVDWQVFQYGNPCFDIAKFLATSFDGEVRRDIMEHDVVGHFYEMLVEEYAKQSDGKMKPNFTVEQAQELFDISFVEQTAMLMTLLHLYSSAKQYSPKVLEANLAKLELRIWLCVQDALELADKLNLDGFADRE